MVADDLAAKLAERGRTDARRYLDRPAHRHLQWGTAAIDLGAAVTDVDACAIYSDALYTEILARAPAQVPAWWRKKHETG